MAILDLVNASNVLKLRLIVYAVLIFFSFFIFIGVALMKNKEFLSRCPLYYESGLSYYKPGPESNCEYPMAIAIMFQLIYLLFRVAVLVLALLGKLQTDFILFSDLFELVYVGVDFLAFFLTFIGACILSAGSDAGYANVDFDWRPASRVAQAGAWISTFLWVFIGLVGFLCLWRSGKIPFIRGGASSTAQSNKEGEGHTQTETPTAPEPTA